jgi:MFS family permease
MTSVDRRDDVSREEAAVPGEVRRWRAFWLLAVAFLMTVVDLAITNVALPTIGRKLHFPQSDLQWVVTAYALTFGGFLLLGGRAADLLGRRRLFVAGLALFTGASLACALATGDTFLILMRGIQGLGVAVVVPAALSIVMNMFREGADRNKALGIWGGIGAAGATIGVLVGGLLTRYAGWQYIFYLNVPIGAAALLLARQVVPEIRLRSARRRYDVLGAVTVTGALVMLVYAISQAPTVGWTAIRTLALLAASAALLAGFLVLEIRAKAPLLPLRLFRLKALAGSNAVGFLLGASFFAFIFIATLYMQQVLGYSALKTGICGAPNSPAPWPRPSNGRPRYPHPRTDLRAPALSCRGPGRPVIARSATEKENENAQTDRIDPRLARRRHRRARTVGQLRRRGRGVVPRAAGRVPLLGHARCGPRRATAVRGRGHLRPRPRAHRRKETGERVGDPHLRAAAGRPPAGAPVW